MACATFHLPTPIRKFALPPGTLSLSKGSSSRAGPGSGPRSFKTHTHTHRRRELYHTHKYLGVIGSYLR